MVLAASFLPANLTAMAMVTLAAAEVTVLPSASCTATVTAGAIATPATVLVGWVMKLSCAAVPGAMSKGLLIPAAVGELVRLQDKGYRMVVNG